MSTKNSSNIWLIPGYRGLLALAFGVTLMLHFRSFCVPHTEGDEVVYLTLARDMNWDLGHYTTRDDPTVSQFPDRIYRSDLFHHPPFFPLVLKVGGLLLGNAPLAGLLFANLAMAFLLYATCRWMCHLQIEPTWGAIALAGVTFCPLLLASSMLVHHDALMGCFMAVGLIAYLEALRQPSLVRAILAGIILCIGLNLRYNSLLFLPILLGIQINHFYRPPFQPGIRATPSRDETKPVSNLLVPGVVGILILTVGLHHYYRILATYGSLLPSSFLIADASAINWPYVQRVARATRWRTILHLSMIFPILLVFLLPATYRLIWQNWKQRLWGSIFPMVFLFLLLAEMWFSYSQIRYFATITPCLFLGLPWLLKNLPPISQKIACYLAALSLLMMIGTGFFRTQVAPPGAMEIMPVLYWYFPPLLPLYHP